MDARVGELQQVIFKKDLMILQLQKHLAAYEQQFGELDASVVRALEAEYQDMDSMAVNTVRQGERRRTSSSAESELRNSASDRNGPRRPSDGRYDSNTVPTTASPAPSALASAASSVSSSSAKSQTPTRSNSKHSAPAAPSSSVSASVSVSKSASASSSPGDTAPSSDPETTSNRASVMTATGVVSNIGKNVVLDFVEDSPMFRRQLEGFEEALSGLRGLLKEIMARTKEYVSAGSRFGEEETALAQEIVHRKYARALFTTSCPELGSLSSMFNEVHDTMMQIQSSRVSMLLSVDALLHHTIQRFAEHELKEASELRKEVTRLADEYESQLGKLLGKSKPSNGGGSNSGGGTGGGSSTNVLPSSESSLSSGAGTPGGVGTGGGGGSNGSLTGGSHSGMGGGSGITSATSSARALEREVMQSRRRFELARFDLVRYLNRVDSQKKFVLVECFNATMYAFLGHFHACHELIKSVETGLRERQDTLLQCKRDFEIDERMWVAQREALDARLQRDVNGDAAIVIPEIRSTRAGSLELPVEIISNETQIGREVFATGSTRTGVVKQGYLFVRNTLFPARSWKRRWFQIHSGKLYQNKTKHMDFALVCDLLLARVKPSTSSNLPFCFEVIGSSQTKHLLQATSDADMNDWIDAARKSTESMLEQQSHRMVVHPEQQRVIEELTTRSPRCADCGQAPSEWVSINIGCFLCIECSGIHRSLGVHVSKVRSLTLDSWEMSLLSLLRDHLGNDVVNSVWEHSVPSITQQKEQGSEHWTRPTASSSREDKTKWIKAKYHFHSFTEPTKLSLTELQHRFLKSAYRGDVRGVMWGLAHGVDVNAHNKRMETALHLAASEGMTACCDYLILNGASLTLADAAGKLPYDAAKACGHEAVKLALMQKMSLEQYQF